MFIIVVGIGKVGRTIAENLAQEGNDLVLIDQNDELLEKVQDEIDIMIHCGNGASGRTLQEAGISRADIIIATTGSDETNMLICMAGKKLGARYAIARIRDPEYNESMMFMQQELGIDATMNPERATAYEISRLLRFPFAISVEHFCKDRVELVEFRVQEGDPMADIPLRDISRKCRDLPQVLYAAVEHNGVLKIPYGDDVMHVGDRIHVVADTSTINAYFRFLGRNMKRVKRLMMLGGGRISYYLIKALTASGVESTIIEIDAHKARKLSEQLPAVSVIHGDGTDQDLLDEEGLRDCDAFVTLCDRDEENLMTGLYAVRQGVPKVVVKNNRVSYGEIFGSMGLDSIVSPRAITCATILRYVRARVRADGTNLEKLYRLMGGKAEALEFVARENDPYLDIPLKDLSVRKNTIVAIILHSGRVKIPFGSDVISAGDTVVVIACETGIGDLNEVLTVRTKKVPG